MEVRTYTDEEIIKLLEAYTEKMCNKCVIKDLRRFCGSCFIDAIKNAPALIKHQKEVIRELLEKDRQEQSEMLTEFLQMVENICAYEYSLSYQKIEEGVKRQMAKKGGE
jgi:hypothetical protein